VYYSLKPVVATVEGVEYWEGHDKDGYAVFKLYSEGAVGLNGVLIACGAKHSFDDYQAHMTICGKVGPKTAEVEQWIERINSFLKTANVSICFDRISFEDIKES
jgi:ABC-type Fe3+-hydroxamate transport system substrate-binding protein